MNISFSHLSTEDNTKKAVKCYFFALTRVRRIYEYDLLFFIVTSLLLWRDLRSFPIMMFWIVMALLLLIIPYLHYMRFWKHIRTVMLTARAFEIPQEYHFTDEYMELKRGDNFSKAVYKDCLTSFVLVKDYLILLNGKLFGGALQQHMFPCEQDFYDFIEVLRHAGLKDESKLPLKRYIVPVLLGILLLIGVCIVFVGRFIDVILKNSMPLPD